MHILYKPLYIGAMCFCVIIVKFGELVLLWGAVFVGKTIARGKNKKKDGMLRE